MRVLVYTSLFPNHLQPDSAVFVQQRMLNFARIPGCRVKVVAPIPFCPVWFRREPWQTFSRVPYREIVDGVDVYHPRYPLLPKVSMPFHGLMMMAGTLYCVNQVRQRFDFDLIDGHYVFPDGLAAVLLGKLFERPVVLSARGSDINQFADFPLIRPQIQYALRHSRHVISVCRALANRMIDLGSRPDTISVVPNGIDSARFHPVPRQSARRLLGMPIQKRIVLSVGSLIERKGFDLLIDAMKQLSDNETDALLYIVGEGVERERLTRQIADLGLEGRVVLAGAVSNQKLATWYSAADVFCLASSREGWANVLMEALACGTPVVATRVWGAPEIVTTTKVGMLVERRPKALADAIRLSLARRWSRKHIRAHVADRSWMVVAREVREIFNTVLPVDGATPSTH